MKVKKDTVKIKKMKTKIQSVANPGIKKVKKKKIQKVSSDSEVAEAVKKECAEKKDSNMPLKQLTWNSYLKVFDTVEKLNKKQKQVMEFCTNKSLTPPRRKQKFLNFIRNCYPNQKDVTDEECNELFDMILKKYDDYKAGTYGVSKEEEASSESSKPSTMKLSKNKKKKVNRSANNKSETPSPAKKPVNDEKWEKIKLKKRKHQKQAVVKESEEEHDSEDMETDG